MIALARAVTLLVALGPTCAHAADIGYLAPPGVAAIEFPHHDARLRRSSAHAAHLRNTVTP